MDVALKPYKRDFDYSYSLGVFPTLELLAARPRDVIRVLASERGERNEGVTKLMALCRRANIPFEVNGKAVERLSAKENTFAVGVFRKYTSILDAARDHIVLVNPGDMGNLGTIARTMLGFGMLDLGIVRPGVDVFDPRAVRASMGALFRLRCQYFDALQEYRASMPKHTLYPFMTDGSVPLDKIRFEKPYTLIFGNEAAGLPPEYAGLGAAVRIPHDAEIDSLNLPVAVGIALYGATEGRFAG